MQSRIPNREPIWNLHFSICNLQSNAPPTLYPLRPTLYSRLPTPYSLRRGFTLVEMLVAMALTLILVYAIAHFYAIIGDAVKDGRAMIELNQQLRGCVERLKSDLDSVTIPLVPWADEGGAAGYFEIKEGPASDWDVNGNYRLDADFDIPNPTDLWPPIIPQMPNAPTAPGDNRHDFTGDPGYSNLLGDTDDIIAMTIRAGSTPFSGQTLNFDLNTGLLTLPNGATPDKIVNRPSSFGATSPYAEVVWWTSFSDINLNGTWDLSEPRLVHRRQLLIRPDLNQLRSDALFPYYVKIPDTLNSVSPTVVSAYDLFQYCDISMRPQARINGFIYFVANSLTDLCRRENRFMHTWPVFEGTPSQFFPYALDLNPNYAGTVLPSTNPDDASSLGTARARHANANLNSQYRWVLFDGGRKGEDVILTNVLGFDVRVFDPDAIVRSDSTAVVPPVTAFAVQPGDAGYAYAVGNGYGAGSHAPYAAIGTGAYVDLGYGIGLGNALPFLTDGASAVTASSNTNFNLLFGNVAPGANAIANSPMLGSSIFRFAGPPAVPNYLPAQINAYRNTLGFTYDTWTLSYERDGIDQNQNNVIDEGTDGLDQPTGGTPAFIGGVDDVSERETVPPYPTPLRGVQVRVRVYEPSTRQTRQATVVGDFIAE